MATYEIEYPPGSAHEPETFQATKFEISDGVIHALTYDGASYSTAFVVPRDHVMRIRSVL